MIQCGTYDFFGFGFALADGRALFGFWTDFLAAVRITDMVAQNGLTLT